MPDGTVMENSEMAATHGTYTSGHFAAYDFYTHPEDLVVRGVVMGGGERERGRGRWEAERRGG
jgi:hypothetical protein